MNTASRENGGYEIFGLKDLMDYVDQSHILQTWKPVALLGTGQFSYVYQVEHRKTGAKAARVLDIAAFENQSRMTIWATPSGGRDPARRTPTM